MCAMYHRACAADRSLACLVPRPRSASEVHVQVLRRRCRLTIRIRCSVQAFAALPFARTHASHATTSMTGMQHSRRPCLKGVCSAEKHIGCCWICTAVPPPAVKRQQSQDPTRPCAQSTSIASATERQRRGTCRPDAALLCSVARAGRTGVSWPSKCAASC